MTEPEMEPTSERARGFRAGIWCDYGNPRFFSGRTGALVAHVARGLLALDEPLSVTLVVSKAQRHHPVVRSLQAEGGNRLTLVQAPEHRSATDWFRLSELLEGWNRFMYHARRIRSRVNRVLGRLKQLGGGIARAGCRAVFGIARRRRAALALLALVAPLVFMLAWLAYAVYRIAVAVARGLAMPFVGIEHVVTRLQRIPRLAVDQATRELIDQVGCDAWILPHAAFPKFIHFPSVLVLEEPEDASATSDDFSSDADWQRTLERASQATICAFLSRATAEAPYYRAMGIPHCKVRVIPPASPVDRLTLLREAASPSASSRPYLLYTGCSITRNVIEGLVALLAELRDRGHDWLDLVLLASATLPAPLEEALRDAGLSGRIRPASDLAATAELAELYKGAFAALVPNLIENESLPLYDALRYGCPVACAKRAELLEQCDPMVEGMLYFDLANTRELANLILFIRENRSAIQAHQNVTSRYFWERSWRQSLREWLMVLKEAAEMASWAADHDRAVIAPWPRGVVEPVRAAGDQPYEVFLFLQVMFLGGVWEATKDLLRDLIAINRQQQKLRFVVGLHNEHPDIDAVRQMDPEMRVVPIRLNPLTRIEVVRMLGREPPWLASRSEQSFLFTSGGAVEALRADAWLALCDRFSLPLLPARPYGVVVYDMIQRYVPEGFNPVFFRHMEEGMGPTMRAARLVLTTSPPTQLDVMETYGLGNDVVKHIPLACDPRQRFEGMRRRRVVLPRTPAILNVTNAAVHKGGRVLLRAYARLKEVLGDRTPLLVMCGVNTHTFSPSYQGSLDHPYWEGTRRLVSDLRLKEGRDVVFLGYVDDEQLHDLYHRSCVVVNSARYDNGSFSMIEGYYFGRPVVASDYPAARYLCERFGVPAKLFPIEDDRALADRLREAVATPLAEGEALEAIRRQLGDAEFGLRRYAERVYAELVQLAETEIQQGKPTERHRARVA